MHLSNDDSFTHNARSSALPPIVIAMNSAATALGQPAGTVKASPRLLVVCLLASVAVHATLLLALPGWWRSTPPEVPATLDVVLMPTDIAQPVVQPPPERPPAAKHTPSVRATQPAAVAPARAEIAVTKTSAEPALPALVETARLPVAASPTAPAAPAAPRSEPVTTPPVFNAAYLRNPPPRYPLAARRSSEEGTVVLRVLVTVDGSAARVELDRSSGSASLDGAALEAVRSWRFVPARRGAVNIEDWVRVPVVFRLES